uniref:C3H1-type domain-containing protein n=1 Tax=Rhizophora mucronata TaxID=61149 RepID=A0A2P2INL1_RHIMU
MMLGEQHRPSPTINVTPWTIVDEPNPELFSPYSGDASSVSDYSRYYLQEALAALQRYLPSNDPEMDSDGEILDSPVDAYSCDHFRMYEFKVRRCARGRSHDWTECPYAHPGEKARRRDPRKYHYSGIACPDFRKGSCKKGDACEFAHGVFECWLHPARYRTQPCKDGPNCRRRVCFFAHTPEQLRVLTHHSPTSLSSAESCEALPLRQAIEASCTKSLPFLSSPVSVSPPASPLVESPPITPSLSRSLGSNSINEMVSSMRKLQMGRFKSLPSSWNIQVGGSGFGSVKGSMIGPGFCSLPTTPTAPLLTRSGRGYPDFWDKALEEEPAMERVESGRDLRAKMLEKLSMENSLDRVDQDPGESIGAPDLGWVSDLLK